MSPLKLITVVILMNMLFASCQKTGGPIDKPNSHTPPATPPPPPPVVFLKDISTQSVPSPYYHFEYDATGKRVVAAFSEGMSFFNIVYDKTGRISEMMNIGFTNRDTIRYIYDDLGRATTVHYIDFSGRVYVRIALTYDGQKLTGLVRERILAGVGFVVNKRLAFSYYDDGNLKELTTIYPAVNGQPESVTVSRFEQYDNKINVDDFALLHSEFFDNLLLLPGVKLQKNNPEKEIFSGNESYTSEISYTYNDKNAPERKMENIQFLSGPNTGQRNSFATSYTYY